MNDEQRISPRDFVTSLARGLEVLRAFGEDAPALTLSQVASRTGLSRAGARRFLLTLLELGYVAREGRLFRLTPKVLGLGYAYLASMPLADTAQPHLEEATRRTGESCSMGVLDGEEVVYIARSRAKRLLDVGIHVGSRFPAHATSMGRVLLAHLKPAGLERYFGQARLERLTPRTVTSQDTLRQEFERVRRQGYAVLDQELEEGIRSVAVPVRSHRNDEVIAAINVSTNVAVVPKERLIREFLPVLQSGAEAIRKSLP